MGLYDSTPVPVRRFSLRVSLMLTPLSSAVLLPWQLSPMMPPAVAAQRRVGEERGQRGLVLDARQIVVGEGRVELLALAGVAQADGDIELVGDVEDVVREHREVAAVLAVDVTRRAAVADRVEAVDRGEDRRAGRAERPRHGRTRERVDAAGRGRAVDARERAARDQAAGGEAAIVAAEAQRVLEPQVFVGVIAADQPVELVAEQGALGAQFLAEGAEAAEAAAVRGTIEDVDRAIIEVAALRRLVAAIAGDRGQLDRAEVIIGLERDAAVAGAAAEAGAGRDIDVAAVGVAERGHVLAEVADDADDIVLRGVVEAADVRH